MEVTGDRRSATLIGIVDDDDGVHESLSSLHRSAGYDAATFQSAEAFLKSEQGCSATCLILDARMPGMTGLELQRRIAGTRRDVSVIFVTAHVDDDVHAIAFEQGAIAILNEPFSDRHFFRPWVAP